MIDMNEVTFFLDRIQFDPRIGPMHISLYMAIVFVWARQGRPERVQVSARDLKPVAKIAGGAPFYRCMKQLNMYGYIVYEPSFNPMEKSKVLLPVVDV